MYLCFECIYKYGDVKMIKIDPEFQSLIPPLTQEEYTQLEQNLISENNPDSIVLFTWDGTLIDGHNRYEICQKHNIQFKTIEKDFDDKDDVKLWIINNQLGRRNISDYSRGKLGLTATEILEKKAKNNIKYGLNKPFPILEKPIINNKELNSQIDEFEPDEIVYEGNENHPLKQNKPEPKPSVSEPINRIKEAAKIASVSTGNISKIKKIEEKASPEVKKELEEGKKSINEVYKEIKKEEKQEARKEEIAQLKLEIEQHPEPINGKYDVIVIDPPWAYGTEYNPEGRRVASPYPEMSLEQIGNINIPASNDCVLWLWTTHKFMRYSFELLDKWGFQDKAILTWVKDRIGIGSWLRSQTEFCIMAVKGSPKITLTNQSTVLNAPLREHSRKPDEFYKMVDSLCVGRKLDYFSREKRDGWSQYGNEVQKF
jgi:N6-adenosine-specific RNA methylase IME4